MLHGGLVGVPTVVATVVVLAFIVEALVEVVLEVVLEVVVQFLGDVVFGPLWRRYGSARVQRVLVGGLVASSCLLLGAGWGWYRADVGARSLPGSIWVSLGLAVAFAGLGLTRPRPGDQPPGDWVRQPHDAWPDPSTRFLPWHWDRARLLNFALANVAIAIGITWGYLAAR